MKLIKKILILEDNLTVLSKIFGKLAILEQNTSYYFTIVSLTDYTQVEKYINNTNEKFDIILLDRDCALQGSFHVLDLRKFDPDKVISISSVSRFNKLAQKRGVTKIVEKDFLNLDEFVQKVIKEIVIMIGVLPDL